jgi:O-succinylhomoserine sulfhydrylase
MDKDDLSNSFMDLKFDTLSVRAGHNRTHEGEHSEPLFLTSSFVFENASEAASKFSGEQEGNVYSRYTNPTVNILEERIAALEGAEKAVATSSGMAAILSTCMALLKSGDHIICSRSVFGATTVLLEKYLLKFNIETTFVSLIDEESWKAAVRPETKIFYLETPSNPLCDVANIKSISKIAKDNNAILIVDNCFCTPALQQPLKLGADLIIHSATKYLDGQGRCLGGIVAGKETVISEILGFVRTAGPTMSPFNAWIFLKGLETLKIRMLAHSSSALDLALWLEKQPQVTKVFYTGLESHPGHTLASKQQLAFGGVLSFKVKGTRKEAWKVIDGTKLISLTANLGDTKTTIIHPATTTHGRLTEKQKIEAGITENLIRIAVGLEDIGDIKNDILNGLKVL